MKNLYTATLRIGPKDDYFHPGTRVAFVGDDVLKLVHRALAVVSMPARPRKELGRLVIDDFERNHTIDASKPYRVVWGGHAVEYVVELTLGDAEVVE